MKNFTATFIDEARLKSLYSRLGFKVIKDFATYTGFEKSHKRFHYESVKKGETKKLSYNVIKPYHYVLQLFMKIELKNMNIVLRKKI